jgi:hypothetical protein
MLEAKERIARIRYATTTRRARRSVARRAVALTSSLPEDVRRPHDKLNSPSP